MEDSVYLSVEPTNPSAAGTTRSAPAAPSSAGADSELDIGSQQPLAPEILGPDRLHFSSFREAEERLGVAQWTAPAGGVPKTEEEDKICIRQLVKAFTNTAKALDSPKSIYCARFKAGYYDPRAVEFCAWNILVCTEDHRLACSNPSQQLVKDLHTSGFRPYIFDQETIKSMSVTRSFTFNRRLKDICEVLEASPTLCRHMQHSTDINQVSKYVAVQVLKGEKMLTLVYNPDKLYNSVLVNSKSNAKRSNWIINGRNADETHKRQPKRQCTTSDATFDASPAPTPTSEAHSAATTASQFTPVNNTARPTPRPQSKKRMKRDKRDLTAFMPTFTSPIIKASSPFKATTAGSSNNIPSRVGVAAPDADIPSSSMEDNTPSMSDSSAVISCATMTQADTVIPGTARPAPTNASPSDMKASPSPITANPSATNARSAPFPASAVAVAAAAEALALMRNGSFVNDMNSAYER